VQFKDSNYLVELGKNIAQIRKEKGFTQESLAYDSDISLSQIARIETGAINPTICTLLYISKRLEVPLKDFFS
jgi:transcriptional regulator with XRE-family HTH domain